LYFDASGQGAKLGIYRVPADSSAMPTLVRELPSSGHITSVSGDKASLMLNDPGTSSDLWLLNLDGSEMKPFRKSNAIERQGAFSPDGKYLAYVSDESGRAEVYVEQVSGQAGRTQISTDGGEQPRWSRKGNEIFYRNGTRMMSVAVRLSPFSATKAVQLFDVPYDRGGAVPGYDVTPDGQHFLMTVPQHPNPTEIRVVVGWPEELKVKSSIASPQR
jgi:Tol biopolymer transport system component